MRFSPVWKTPRKHQPQKTPEMVANYTDVCLLFRTRVGFGPEVGDRWVSPMTQTYRVVSRIERPDGRVEVWGVRE